MARHTKNSLEISDLEVQETLLDISLSISNIKERKELFYRIHEKIKPLLGFDDMGLFIVDEERDLFWELLEEDTTSLLQDELAQKDLLGPWTYSGQPKEAWIYADEITIFDVQEQADIYANPQWKFMIEAGLTKMMAAPLVFQGKRVGLLCFTSKDPDFFNSSCIPIFDRIASILSSSVNNILAFEQIKQREKEKSMLLDITRQVAKLNSLEEFLIYVTQSLKPIFNFYDSGVFILTDDGKYHFDLAGHHDAISPSPWNKQIFHLDVQKQIHEGSLIEWMMMTVEQEGPVHLFDFKDLGNRFPNYYQFELSEFKNQNYRDCLAGNLKIGDQLIGMFCINALEKDHFKPTVFSLLEQVVRQLSVAVSSILSAEKMKASIQFSETLLSVTEAMVRIQNRGELFSVLFSNIKSVFPFDEFGVFVLDQSGTQHYELTDENTLEELPSQGKVEDIFGKNAHYEHSGSSVEWLMHNGPIVLTLEALDKAAPHPHHELMMQQGLSQVIAGPLKQGDEAFGMLNFTSKNPNQYSEKDLPLFQSITDQLAVVTSNLLANEEIQRREAEKSLQVAITNLMTKDLEKGKEVSWDHQIEQLAMLLMDPIPYNHLHVTLRLSKESERRFDFFKNENGQLETIPNFEILKTLGVDNADDYQSLTQQLTPLDKIKRFYNSEAYHVLVTQYPLLRETSVAYDLRSGLFYQVDMGESSYIALRFFSRDPHHFEKYHIHLLEQLEAPLQLSVQNILAFQHISELKNKLKQEKEYLMEEVQIEHNFENIIGNSPVMLRLFNQINQIAPHDSTVLITGQTGTGKELVARAIHNQSSRKENPMIKVNCAALPEHLIESELFGHEKGAFTGAIQQRAGKFELAHRGTIFLDEVGELPLELQTKLLRVLQEKEFERLGGNKVIQTDCRVIAATNRTLEKEVANGTFREDLYYRLSVFPLHVPSLSERKDDIPLLVNYFAMQFCKKMRKSFEGIDNDAMQKILNYEWHGNVRELENLIEHAVILHNKGPLQLSRSLGIIQRGKTGDDKITFASSSLDDYDHYDPEEIERQRILAALRKTLGRVSGPNGAARLLRLKPSTLEYRIKKLDLLKKHKIIKNEGLN